MIRREGDRMFLSGALTLASVADVLREGGAAISEGVRTVDLGEVGELDSSALALLLAWLREAKSRNASLSFANLPEGLTTIAKVYGVAELLHASPASSAPVHH
jgi:phospholipid transport system transporter-binding protein